MNLNNVYPSETVNKMRLKYDNIGICTFRVESLKSWETHENRRPNVPVANIHIKRAFSSDRYGANHIEREMY